MEYQKACRALTIADAVFSQSYIKWFLCFGNLLHLIRDKTIEPDKDIDVGVFYEVADADRIINGFKQWQYEISSITENDIDHKPFNICFKHKGNQALPPVDVFFWYLNGKYRYHTYDILQERRPRPSTYIFKGVPAKLLPDPNSHWREDKKLVRTFFGPWNKPYFRFEVPIPLMYGSLLDIWYPNWLKPQKIESMSPYVVKIKNPTDWHTADEQHEVSKREYEEQKKALL